MNKKIRFLVQGGMLAALYVVLTYAQNLLWPGSTSMTIQMRLSEALCIFAFFTPAAIPGLTIGCLLYNISWAETLPLDWLIGTLATLLATCCMWGLRKVKIAKCPFLGLIMPGVWNALLVGWELTIYFGENGFTWPVFGINALYVFLGEAIVLLVLGTILYYAFTSRGLNDRLFPESK